MSAKTWGWLVLFLLLFAVNSIAQPTLESATAYNDNTDGTSFTTGSITVPSASNLAIVIAISSGDGDDKTVTSATWSLGGGESFTEVVTAGDNQPTDPDLVTIMYLANPTQGSGTVSWTHAETMQSGAITVFVLSGAQQTLPTIFGTDTGAGTMSIGLTTTVDNSLLIMCTQHGNGTIALTWGTGQTERSDFQADGQRHGTSTEVKVSAGLETLTSDPASGSPVGASAAIAVAPFIAAEPDRRRILPFRFE